MSADSTPYPARDEDVPKRRAERGPESAAEDLGVVERGPAELELPPGVAVVRLRSTRGQHAHPWVYRRTIRSIEAPPGGRRPRSGDEVVVLSGEDEPIGRGVFHGQSTIAVRLLTADLGEAIDREFLRRRLREALSLRREVLRLDRVTNAFRLVHGEGDGLSGLVIDVYDRLIVVQYHSLAFHERRDDVLAALRDLFPEARVIERVDPGSARHEGMIGGGPPVGEEPVEIVEGKMRFLVDPAGHKTGFFLDQRENRQAFAELVRGRKVLDAFCYTGGFSVAARTLGKARRVVAVDLDEDAVAHGKRNAERNRAAIEWEHADCFDFLRRQRHAVERFDAIVLDPPKWATSRERLDDAERRYVDINTLALQAIAPGGIFLTCSCSGLVSEEKFVRTVRHAAERAGRDLQVFRLAGGAADHPVAIHCPESRYLKALFARVR